MKKKTILAGLCCLSLAMPFALTACGGSDSPSTSNGLASANDVYGMGAVSSVKLLGSSVSANALGAFSTLNAAATDTATDGSQDGVKDYAQKFNEYFAALDSFLGEDIVSTSTETNADMDYAYETKMTITGRDMENKPVTYAMYYTEELVKADVDGGETENEYKLVGVMEIDGVACYLEGERSEEWEADESESELCIRAYADVSDKTYIQMEQEYSVENGETETEYVYSVYADGVLVEQTAIEFETEQKNNKLETAYELEFRNGDAKGKYSIEREQKDGKTSIKVKYNIDNKSGVFHIREIIGEDGEKQYEYSYSDGFKQVFDK